MYRCRELCCGSEIILQSCVSSSPIDSWIWPSVEIGFVRQIALRNKQVSCLSLIQFSFYRLAIFINPPSLSFSPSLSLSYIRTPLYQNPYGKCLKYSQWFAYGCLQMYRSKLCPDLWRVFFVLFIYRFFFLFCHWPYVCKYYSRLKRSDPNFDPVKCSFSLIWD